MVLKSNIDEILPLESVFMVLESNIDEKLPLETVLVQDHQQDALHNGSPLKQYL